MRGSIADENYDKRENKEKRFFVLSRAWDKEKILSLHEESNLRPSDSALQCSTVLLEM